MSEDQRIVQVCGEPLPAGCVGVRVRVRMSGSPGRRWSRGVSACLVNELVGHTAVGYLRLNDIVHGDQMVLEGVEASEAAALGGALRRAVDATNQACTAERNLTANVERAEADAIAHQVALGAGRPERGSRSPRATATR